MKIPNDPKLFEIAKPILAHMTLNWADDRGYYDNENARSLALLAVSECSQLCEIFQYYSDDPNLRIPRKETQYMAEEEIGDIVLTLLRFTFTEKKEAECRNKVEDNVDEMSNMDSPDIAPISFYRENRSRGRNKREDNVEAMSNMDGGS
jgi:hypothetical protein